MQERLNCNHTLSENDVVTFDGHPAYMKTTYATNSALGVSKPRGAKDRLRAKARGVTLDVLSTINRREDKNYLRCLFCHHVFDDQLSAFEEILKRLSTYGRFVDTRTCEKMIRGEVPIEGRLFHLSFDDGFKNNFSNAFPILKRLNIPAVFFVPTSIIDADYGIVKDYCLNVTNYPEVFEMMSWDNLKELVENGYEVGSHTQTHARLSEVSLDNDRLLTELTGSKLDIEKNLGVDCNYISWPYGRVVDVDKTALHVIKTLGYSACFGGYRGTVVAQTTDIMDIPRHHFEVHWPLRHTLYFARGNGE